MALKSSMGRYECDHFADWNEEISLYASQESATEANIGCIMSPIKRLKLGTDVDKSGNHSEPKCPSNTKHWSLIEDKGH